MGQRKGEAREAKALENGEFSASAEQPVVVQWDREDQDVKENHRPIFSAAHTTWRHASRRAATPYCFSTLLRAARPISLRRDGSFKRLEIACANLPGSSSRRIS